MIVLAFCWAHLRRDFLDGAKSWPDLQVWMLSWVEMIGEIYDLNAKRLEQWDEARALADQSPVFMQRHQALQQALEQMEKRGDTELAKENLRGVQRDLLKSLKNHWRGLTVFVKSPQVPMDNNTAERRMRNPGMGRKNYYGSGRQWSGELAARMFSLFQTILLWQLNPHHWLYGYLMACAENGGQPPMDITPFMPWQMSEERKQQLAKPMPMAAVNPSVAAQLSTPQPP